MFIRAVAGSFVISLICVRLNIDVYMNICFCVLFNLLLDAIESMKS